MESSTIFILPRGFVDTTATDGRRLRIYYIREIQVQPIDAESTIDGDANAAAIIRAKRLRAAEIEVLRDFAAAYTRGERDLNGYTPSEAKHITIDLASEESWREGLGFARTGLHVFSVDDVMAMGYQNYDKKNSRKRNYQGTIRLQLDEARNLDLRDECQGL
ncbi:hypothetical protein E4U13_008378 [Claviceps humidiphila]|uniref:Uncharacterized protein n=1 Tax=Claviceps humidiphila TaxID=1294629 RepID=A0A9P7PUN9_9HYPO|nr:hypothetical protein E4U13_008378 [Claviceps humidiphila]